MIRDIVKKWLDDHGIVYHLLQSTHGGPHVVFKFKNGCSTIWFEDGSVKLYNQSISGRVTDFCLLFPGDPDFFVKFEKLMGEFDYD